MLPQKHNELPNLVKYDISAVNTTGHSGHQSGQLPNSEDLTSECGSGTWTRGRLRRRRRRIAAFSRVPHV